MLKVAKWVLIIIGIVLIVVTIVLMVWDVFQINTLVTVANANQSAQGTPNPNPRLWVLLGAVAALIGGFALGFGLGLPRRTFKQRLQDQNNPAPAVPPTA